MADLASPTEAGPSYAVRPSFKEKFPVHRVKDIIRRTLEEKLTEQAYQTDTAPTLTKELADLIKRRLRELDMPRYKIMVQVVIGEQRGEGVRMGCRCFWDADTDSQASETFMNDSLFCAAVAFGVYQY